MLSDCVKEAPTSIFPERLNKQTQQQKVVVGELQKESASRYNNNDN